MPLKISPVKGFIISIPCSLLIKPTNKLPINTTIDPFQNDSLDKHFGEAIWSSIGSGVKMKAVDILAEVQTTELTDVIEIWQEAFEWTYYEQVLSGIKLKKSEAEHLNTTKKSFQALLCIDDRECSFRRYIEQLDKHAETFGTPGFFGVEF